MNAMIKRIGLFLFFSCSLLLIPACENDTPADGEGEKGPSVAELLPGRWELTSAMRAGRQTELLTGTYFEFTPEGQMITNFGIGNGQDRKSYTLEDKMIRLPDDKMQLSYEVVLINDTTLVLATSIRDIPFEMTFAKAKADEGELQ